MITLILALFATFLIFGIKFLIFNLLTKTIDIKPKKILNFNLINFFIIFFLSLVAFVRWFDSNKNINYETAYIIQKNKKFEIILQGKRKLMSHDLILILKNSTYHTKNIFLVNKNIGIIDGSEIITFGGYELKGSLTIKRNILTVNLFYDNIDDNTLDRCDWNGKYNIKS